MRIPIRIREPPQEVVSMRICLTDPDLSVITCAIITQLRKRHALKPQKLRIVGYLTESVLVSGKR